MIKAFIEDFADTYHYAPTVREIANHVDLSLSTTHYHLTVLRESGEVDWGTDRNRTIRVIT